MSDGRFQLVSPFEPKGDQPQAIAQITENLERGLRHQTLLGITGSGIEEIEGLERGVARLLDLSRLQLEPRPLDAN